MISLNALNKLNKRRSSKFQMNFDSSPSSITNQAFYNTQLNLVQLAQLQRLQKLKLLQNSFNQTIPKMNYLIKSVEKQQMKNEAQMDQLKENISECLDQVRFFAFYINCY